MAFITVVPVAPLRAEAAHRSEMVSQLLFGELCDVIETANDFLKVKCRYDGYEGWCQRSQLADYKAEEYIGDVGFVSSYTTEVLINNESCIIPFAAAIEKRTTPAYDIGQLNFLHVTPVIHFPTDDGFTVRLLKEFAFRFIGTSYLWGGKSVFGVDCSGFVQQVYKMLGIWLPRDAYQQAEIGESIGFLQETKPGDLAFFDNSEGRITHVGILLDEQTIIHASGNVHVDNIDHAGIINKLTGQRTHKLRLIKRVGEIK